MNDEKIQELEAMIIVLAKKIDKLEGKTSLKNSSSYLKELKDEAFKLLKFWH